MKPSTQEKREVATQALVQFLGSAGLQIIYAALTGEKFNTANVTKIGLTSLATTISTQGPAIRQLQGTNLILDPDATALALQNSGTPKEAARVIAIQVVQQIKQEMANGVSANTASEVVAQKIDTGASIAALGVTP